MHPTAKIAQADSLARTKLGERTTERIGNTPLLRPDRISRELPNVQILGKAEWYNPGGSVKDRAAFNIISEGRLSGKFTPGKILLDSTSSNTGIAYAMIGAAEGFQVTLCMPEMFPLKRSVFPLAKAPTIIIPPATEASMGATQSIGRSKG